MSNDQAAEILVELNDNKVEYEVPINQMEKIQDVLANGNKENEIIEAAKKLRGKIPTPKAKKEFDKNSTGMRMCRIGNRNVALFPHTLHTLLNDVEDTTIFSKTRMNTPGQWIRQSVS